MWKRLWNALDSSNKNWIVSLNKEKDGDSQWTFHIQYPDKSYHEHKIINGNLVCETNKVDAGRFRDIVKRLLKLSVISQETYDKWIRLSKSTKTQN